MAPPSRSNPVTEEQKASQKSGSSDSMLAITCKVQTHLARRLVATPEAHTTALGTPQHVGLPASEIYVAKLLRHPGRHLTATGDT